MKGRIFRTTVDTPDKPLMERISQLFTDLVAPFIFEIVNLEAGENQWEYTFTCKATGKLTDIGRTWMKELKERE